MEMYVKLLDNVLAENYHYIYLFFIYYYYIFVVLIW